MTPTITEPAWSPPEPTTRLMTARDVAERLSLSLSTASHLLNAGFATHVAGSSLLVDPSVIEGLAVRQVLTPQSPDLPAAIVVKMGLPQRDETNDPRPYLGYHKAMPEAIVEAATCRWWSVARPHELTAKPTLLVVSVCGFVQRVRLIESIENFGGRIAFNTSPVDHSVYHEARLNLPHGPSAVRLNC